MLPGRKDHLTGILPAPTRARHTQFIGKGPIIDFKLKSTGALPTIPRRRPIVGAYIDVISTSLCKLHSGGSVFHSTPHTMGHKIGRLDLIESLMIQHPASALCKRFGFDQHLRSHCSLHGQQSTTGCYPFCFHHPYIIFNIRYFTSSNRKTALSY